MVPPVTLTLDARPARVREEREREDGQTTQSSQRPMAGNLSANEEAQLEQTIGMFEVIAESTPNDYQSLEILKEAYLKLGRTKDVVHTSKRIAKAYEQLGSLSSAILEYESILELQADDPDVKAALADIVSRANSFGARPVLAEMEAAQPPRTKAEAARTDAPSAARPTAEISDGKERMRAIYVDGKHLNSGDFERYWKEASPPARPTQVCESFIQVLAEKAGVPLEQSLKLIVEHSRLCYIPIDRYEVDAELARQVPREICFRWCVIPFDKMSKSVLIATANPWNLRAQAEVQEACKTRLLWYVASPVEIARVLRKIFR